LSKKRAEAGKKGAASRWGSRPDAPTPPPPKSPPPLSPPALTPIAPVKVSESDDPKAIVLETLQTLRAQLQNCPKDEIPKVATAITSSNKLLAQLTGSLEVSQIQLLRSKAWREVYEILESVLRRHPAALKEIKEAFDAYSKR
jgi:hypothetical protein